MQYKVRFLNISFSNQNKALCYDTHILMKYQTVFLNEEMTFKMCFNPWLSSAGKPTDQCIIDLKIINNCLFLSSRLCLRSSTV